MRKKIVTVIILIVVVGLAYGAVRQFTDKEASQTAKKTEKVKQLESIQVDKLNSDHCVVVDLKQDKVLYEKAADEQTRPASLAKLMTALVIIENTEDFDEKVTIPHDVYTELNGRGIALAGFEDGESISVLDHLHGILYLSGAECCVTMARRVAGSEEGLVQMMNEKAEALNMNNTTFGNVIGLDDPACYTTVNDMAKLLKYALKNKTFRQIFASYAYTLQPTNKCDRQRTIHNGAISRFGDDRAGVIGGKLGNTSAAALCLASLAEIEGNEYICITTHASPTEAMASPHVQDARRIYRQIETDLSVQ